MASPLRAWIGGTAVLAALLLVASWFLLIAPERAQAQQLLDSARTTASANEQLRMKVAQLRREYVALPAKREELVGLQQHLPTNLALSQLTRQLDAASSSAGVSLKSIAPGAPAVSTTDASTGIVDSTVTLEVTGDLAHLQVFLQDVQTLPRDFLITALSAAVDAGTDSSGATTSGGATASTTTSTIGATQLTMNITGTVFVLPNAATGAATAPTTGAAAGTAPAASATTTTPAS